MSITFFQWAFYALIPVTAVLAFFGKPASARQAGYSPEFFRLRRRYLFAWYACVAVDWLHGPYLYDLYCETHALPKKHIGLLYVVGTGVPALAGPLCGIIADRFGRRRCCLVYCGLYSVTSALSHFSSFPLLLIGSVFSGIAIQILYSMFESWLVHAHHSQGLPSAALDNIFAHMWFGNYFVAVLAGVLAQLLADYIPTFRLEVLGLPVIELGAYTAPFDAALLFCLVGAILVHAWDDDLAKSQQQSLSISKENFTLSNSGEAAVSWRSAIARPEVLLCGTVLFGVESSMYIFSFHWTGALKEDDRPFTHHGYVFASFMMSSMIGSTIYSLASYSAERLLLVTVAILTIAWLSVSGARHLAPEWGTPLTLAAFLMLEACFGTYFPAMSTMKSIIVPEGARSFVYSAYRAPMNLVVSMVLFLDLPFALVSIGCIALAAVAVTAAAALNCTRLKSADAAIAGSISTFVDSSGSQVELEPSSSDSY